MLAPTRARVTGADSEPTAVLGTGVLLAALVTSFILAGTFAAISPTGHSGLRADATPTNLAMEITAIAPASSPGYSLALSGGATGAVSYGWSGSDHVSSSTYTISDLISSSTTYTFKACDSMNNCATDSFELYFGATCDSSTCIVGVGCNPSLGCTALSIVCGSILQQGCGVGFVTLGSHAGNFGDSTWSGTSLVAPLNYTLGMGNAGNTLVYGVPASFQYSSGGAYTVSETITDVHGTQAFNSITVNV
jgi:hypothetical protein